jgi:cell growth-regulating nucleolar protein
VKKPKLDRHYGQCHASFTCIDCSATFSGPPQWKGHTTCITEAEKYQKSLYKGAKKVCVFTRSCSYLTFDQGQDPRPSNGNTQVSKIPGKYHQSQNNQQSWSRRQYAPNYVSGANTTPLGSPPRMSPVDSSPVDSPGNAPETEPKVGKKRDSGVIVEARYNNVHSNYYD